MWVFTPLGFYSVVAHRDQPDHVIVRTRVREDLLQLQRLEGRDGREITTTLSADYPYRITISRDRWAELAETLAARVDYPNFKTAVGERQSSDRARIYMQIWQRLLDLEKLDATIAPSWPDRLLEFPPAPARR